MEVHRVSFRKAKRIVFLLLLLKNGLSSSGNLEVRRQLSVMNKIIRAFSVNIELE